MQKYGYNLQRDGWLNAFTDGVLWQGAREKHHVFFSIFLATLTDKNDVIMDWQCGVGTHYLYFPYFKFSVIFSSLVSILTFYLSLL